MPDVFKEPLTERSRALLDWMKPAVKLTHDLQTIDNELHDLKRTGDEYDEAAADAIRLLKERRREVFQALAWYRLQIMQIINATDFRQNLGHHIRERTATLMRRIAVDHFIRGMYITSVRGDFTIQNKYNLGTDNAKRLYRAAVNQMAEVWDGSTPTPPNK